VARAAPRALAELFTAWLFKANLAALTRITAWPQPPTPCEHSPGSPGRRGRSRCVRYGFIAGSRVLPGWVVPLAALVAGLGFVSLAHAPGELPLLPLLLPLALLGAQVLNDLRRGAANSLAWFGAMTFSLLGGLIWLGYCALQTGFPPRIAAMRCGWNPVSCRTSPGCRSSPPSR